MDEANLDVTDYLIKNNLNYKEGRILLANQIWSEIKLIMKMTSSVGIAPNKMLSKICSEINKPDGMTYLPFDKQVIHQFMK